MRRTPTITVVVAVALATGAAADPARTMVVVPFEAAKFVSLDPKQPDAAQLATLWGDPATGPSAVFLKLKKGAGQLHVHTSDYHLVLVRGTMKHWGAGQTEAQVKPLGPGAFWFQPGGEAHAGSCLSDECVMYVQWAGKRDSRVADAPKK